MVLFSFSTLVRLKDSSFVIMALVYRCRHFSAERIFCFTIIGIAVSIQSSVAAQMSCKLMKPNTVVENEAEYFTNTWAVRVLGGVGKAKSLAKRLGYDFHKKVSQS
jgi:hypothetical protein